LSQLVTDCWNPKPKFRPSFPEIIVRLRRLRALALPAGDLGSVPSSYFVERSWKNDLPFNEISDEDNNAQMIKSDDDSEYDDVEFLASSYY
jgi:hypothetical protein